MERKMEKRKDIFRFEDKKTTKANQNTNNPGELRLLLGDTFSDRPSLAPHLSG